MEKGAVDACCKFVWETDLASVSTGVCKQVGVNIDHCLLRHKKKDSMRKTAKELGWGLTHGMLKTCKHCAKLKVKQKNV
jgi:hypothetical protein